VPPKTILAHFKGGKVGTSSDADELKWAFTSPKAQVVLVSDSGSTVTTLEHIVKDNPKIDCVWQHNAFTAGVPPAVLVAKKPVALTGVAEECRKTLKAVAKDANLTSAWRVAIKGTKIEPCGVAVVAKKQLIITSESRWTQQ
jgi:hypothetical protein